MRCPGFYLQRIKLVDQDEVVVEVHGLLGSVAVPQVRELSRAVEELSVSCRGSCRVPGKLGIGAEVTGDGPELSLGSCGGCWIEGRVLFGWCVGVVAWG